MVRLCMFVLGIVAMWVATVSPVYADTVFQVLASNNPPFNYQDEAGEVRGIALDVIKVIMKRAGARLDARPPSVINWARAVYRISNESGYILLSPARTPEREAMFAWVGPLHSFRLGFIARKDRNVSLVEREDVSHYEIGVIRDSAPIQALEKEFGISREELTELAEDEHLFRMPERGRVDIVPRGAMSAMYWLERIGLDPDDYEMVHVFRELDLYIGFSPSTDPGLIGLLNEELRKIKTLRPDGSSEYQEIVSRHIHGKIIESR